MKSDRPKPRKSSPGKTYKAKSSAPPKSGSRPAKPYSDKSGDDRPRFSDKPKDGEKRPYSPRSSAPPKSGDRPARPYSDRPNEDKPRYSDKPQDGEKRPYSPRSSAPPKSGDRPTRPYSDRPQREDRPARPYSDRPQSEDRPYKSRSGTPPKSGARPSKPAYKPREDKPRDETSPRYSDRPQSEDRPYKSRSGTPPKSGARPSKPHTDRPQREESPRYDKPQTGENTSRSRYGTPPKSGARPKTPRVERPYEDAPRQDDSRDENDNGRAYKGNPDGPKRFNKNSTTSPRTAPRASSKRSPMLERPSPNKPIIDAPIDESDMRLNRYLAHCGVASRRAAADIIGEGKVTINGAVVREIGYRVQPNDVVVFNGEIINTVDEMVYILMNKPKHTITTVSDEKGRKTVMDIVGQTVKARIYPVGRLDRDTTGLLLLTNDGELAQKLSHPSGKVKKLYHVLLDKNVMAEDLEKIKEGIMLEDGKALVDSVAYDEEGKSKKEVIIEIHLGKNRIVRRIFESLGYAVERLDRIYYAGLTKKDLPRGNYRALSEREIIMLKHFTSTK
jgi:23S rRNA pseudouridine2605 synthase